MGSRAALVGTLVVAIAAAPDLASLAYAQAPAVNQTTNVPRPAAAPSTFPVALNSGPPGANIYVDDQARGIQGQTGPSSVIRLPRGSRQILLQLDGFQSLEVTLDLWQAQHLNFILKPAPALNEMCMAVGYYFPATGSMFGLNSISLNR